MNNRRKLVIALGAGALAAPFASFAQQVPTKGPRIGYLSSDSRSTIASRIEAFQLGLRELGRDEGKNIVIEWRFAEGKAERLSGLAAELVRLNVDLIVTTGPAATRAAKDATVTIPIVMAQDSDPVGNGLVASLARPGRNITGLSSLAAEISGKRLELLKEIVPRLSRVAVFGSSITPGNGHALKETELAAKTLGVQFRYVDVLAANDIAPAFQTAAKARADAILVLSSVVVIAQRPQIADLAVKSHLPTIYDRGEFVEDGGLMSYGTNFTDLSRRAATYADRILKGGKPAELPVEQPTKFELVVNIKTAKALGIKIPNSILVQATKVIE
jgi:putative ABC transport system substrate-binding protein